MRTYILMAFVVAVGLYAWRNWFIAVCVLVVMDAIMKHGDMPRSLFGIQGFNLWNLLLLLTVLAWLKDRLRTGERLGTPAGVRLVVAGYVLVIVVACVRGLMDLASIRNTPEVSIANTPLGFLGDYLINPLKYILVAVLLYDGARTRKNMQLALLAILGQVVLYALRVAKYIPPGVLLMSENRYRSKFQSECGLHANDMALVMVIGFWTAAGCIGLWSSANWRWRLVGLGAALASFWALGLTLSRGGYLAFTVVGLVLGLVRWRKFLVCFPVGILLACLAFPSIPARISQGFGEKNVEGTSTDNLDTISAGRTTALWPPALEQISQEPILGHGRMTILRTAMRDTILATEGVCPDHPHNAYLEVLLDSGVAGLCCVLGLFVGLPIAVLIRHRTNDPLLEAGVTSGLAGACAILTMGLSGQSFFPREGVFLVLCTYAVMARAYVICREQNLMDRRGGCAMATAR